MRSLWRNLSWSSPIALVSFTLPCVGDGINLGECISGIYTWSLTIVGLAAFLNIIYGGWLVVTAFGNTGKVGEATKRITNAVLGIVLLFSSYLILRTINPDLVGGTIKLPKITKEDQIKNTGDDSDLTKIEKFEVAPSQVDLSDNTLLRFKLSIFGSKEGIDKLCGAGTKDPDVFYRVYLVDTGFNPPTSFLVRSFAWRRDEFGTGGKTLDRSFDQNLKTGAGGSTFSQLKAGMVQYKAEFRCPFANGQYKELNTSTVFPVKIVP